MFAKLFFVRDENSIARIVLQGLYPQKYLDADDESDPGHPNFDRLKKVGLSAGNRETQLKARCRSC